MISTELKKIYAGDTGWVPLETLEFSHSMFSQPYFIVNDHQNWRFKTRPDNDPLNPPPIVEFLSIPFRLKLPDRDAGGAQELEIVMSNISRTFVDELERSNTLPAENIACTMRVYRNLMDSEPEIDPPMRLYISSVMVEADAIVATASRYDVLNRSFPSRVFSQYEFPGLLR